MHKLFKFVFISIVLLTSGCATTPYIAPTHIKTGGTYHRVERGQTLWRISKIYNVDIDDIIQANNIISSAKINVGQLIFIPGAKQPLKESNTNINYNVGDSSFIWPLRGKIVSYFMDTTGQLVNKGIDIQASRGTQIVASRTGIVSFVDNTLRAYGKTIIIDHGDGLSTVYAYNSRVLVKPGDRSVKGTPIAFVGINKTTGIAQLHFEIRKGHKPKNPLYYLP